jgi:hypothetical protein
MNVVLLLLAIAGFLAAVRGIARAGLGLLVRGVEVVMADEATSIQARRGDLTGLGAADARSAAARRRRLTSIAAVAAWAAMLVVPPLTPWPTWLYAAWAVLWLLPARRS